MRCTLTETQIGEAKQFCSVLVGALRELDGLENPNARADFSECFLVPISEAIRPLFMELARKELELVIEAGEAVLLPFVSHPEARRRMVARFDAYQSLWNGMALCEYMAEEKAGHFLRHAFDFFREASGWSARVESEGVAKLAAASDTEAAADRVDRRGRKAAMQVQVLPSSPTIAERAASPG